MDSSASMLAPARENNAAAADPIDLPAQENSYVSAVQHPQTTGITEVSSLRQTLVIK